MELKKIDSLWHFFATQNQLFLKKRVDSKVQYCLNKNQINVCHCFNPKFVGQSSLTIHPVGFEMGMEHYASGQKKFGIKPPNIKVHQKLFFPKELLKLNAKYTIYVEKDRFRNLKIILEPFHPKNIKDILHPVNFITENLWGFRFFSEIIKN
ncbi:MAG: hypothetical protein WD398_10425 [Cyclobacteriaceae bacterium]